MKKLISYFFQGLLLTAPIAATIFVVYKLFLFIDNILPLDIPGLGLVLIILLITLLGYIGTFYFASPFFSFLERMLEKAPLVKVIYSSVKDLISAFVGEKKRFNHPVLVTINKESGVQQIGFVTQNDLTSLGIEGAKAAVYLPLPYSFMGTLVIVPNENITPIDKSGTEMMKFVISGGVAEVAHNETNPTT